MKRLWLMNRSSASAERGKISSKAHKRKAPTEPNQIQPNLIQFDSKSNGIFPIQTQSKLNLTSNQNLKESIRFQIEQA